MKDQFSFLLDVFRLKNDICDLHGHRRPQVMVRDESLYMSSYL